jgi:hypothetical protein
VENVLVLKEQDSRARSKQRADRIGGQIRDRGDAVVGEKLKRLDTETQHRAKRGDDEHAPGTGARATPGGDAQRAERDEQQDVLNRVRNRDAPSRDGRNERAQRQRVQLCRDRRMTSLKMKRDRGPVDNEERKEQPKTLDGRDGASFSLAATARPCGRRRLQRNPTSG